MLLLQKKISFSPAQKKRLAAVVLSVILITVLQSGLVLADGPDGERQAAADQGGSWTSWFTSPIQTWKAKFGKGDAPEHVKQKTTPDKSGVKGNFNQGSNQDIFGNATMARDLMQLAKDGKLRGAVGRDDIIRQVVAGFQDPDKGSVLLVAEPGVGKTTVANEIAKLFQAGKIPQFPPEKTVYIELILSGLQAGTAYRGQLGEKVASLKKQVADAQAKGKKVIIYIDEAHQLNAQGDATMGESIADALKPPMAKGEFKIFATTTIREAEQTIAKDGALMRRFDKIIMGAPDDLITVVRSMAAYLENPDPKDPDASSGLLISDEAIKAVIKNSYMVEEKDFGFSPDRERTILSRVMNWCAQAFMKSPMTSVVDAALEHLDKEYDRIAQDPDKATRREAILKERPPLLQLKTLLDGDASAKTTGVDQIRADFYRENKAKTQVDFQLKALQIKRDYGQPFDQTKLDALQVQSDEKQAVLDQYRVAFNDRMKQIRPLVGQIFDEYKPKFVEAMETDPGMNSRIGAEQVLKWLSMKTGARLQDLRTADVEKLATLQEDISKEFVGHKNTIQAIVDQIIDSKAGSRPPGVPLASFIVSGPRDTGKSYLQEVLAKVVMEDSKNMITVNAAELGGYGGIANSIAGKELLTQVAYKRDLVIRFTGVDNVSPEIQKFIMDIVQKGSVLNGDGRKVTFGGTIVMVESSAGGDIKAQQGQASLELPIVMAALDENKASAEEASTDNLPRWNKELAEKLKQQAKNTRKQSPNQALDERIQWLQESITAQTELVTTFNANVKKAQQLGELVKTGNTQARAQFDKAFSAEFANAFGGVYLNSAFRPEDMPTLVDKQIDLFNREVAVPNGYRVVVGDELRKQLIIFAQDPAQGGATLKGLRSIFESNVINPVKGARKELMFKAAGGQGDGLKSGDVFTLEWSPSAAKPGSASPSIADEAVPRITDAAAMAVVAGDLQTQALKGIAPEQLGERKENKPGVPPKIDEAGKMEIKVTVKRVGGRL